ncbi:DUF4031 domain-containing protein [Pseudoclavibacter sp. VKM Ac-2867]|uniref:DUF4031 domain-containing protein n=1 Tax=Pseudoclavibacter sp. VKM Ac-2867 TaxID=2783829 RepID=UPI00188BDF4E|nr:DUF4031 domain-containing protein [Pseudoclavibacter sp. VKM Ac-2867]MBF4458632.1 DUF4031 domain-containing protein [Pseudoclavibacter sp. VKM Ac-2867]
MVILIDPPVWPAHGTTFSHLVSDDSVDELHAFARKAGIRDRAFDVDHYDVPAEQYGALVALGAEPVGGSELVRRLVAGGVRVPARDRPKRARLTLVRRWAELELPVTGGRQRATDALRDELLDAWSAPSRHYHDVTHLLSVLDAIDIMRLRAAETREPLAERELLTARLAAWFHDAVYEGAAGDDERASADLAVERLTALGVDSTLVADVERLVLATIVHTVAESDAAGQILMDADLAVLARSEDGYARYVALVKRDFAHVTDEQWRAGRASVLETLLATPRLFVSPAAPEDWEERARRNLEHELDALRR